MYTTQYNKTYRRFEQRVDVLNKPETLTLDFDEDDLPPLWPLKHDEEVMLEPEEFITERIKHKPGKRKIIIK